MSEPRPWRRAALWLAFLGPFFFASYGFANGFASTRAHVGVIAFDWERNIPFLPWTIVPYWSIDVLYAISFFVAQAIESARKPVLVCCALGYSRSASAVVAWLLMTRRAASYDEAVAMVRKARPSIVLHST